MVTVQDDKRIILVESVDLVAAEADNTHAEPVVFFRDFGVFC